MQVFCLLNNILHYVNDMWTILRGLSNSVRNIPEHAHRLLTAREEFAKAGEKEKEKRRKRMNKKTNQKEGATCGKQIWSSDMYIFRILQTNKRLVNSRRKCVVIRCHRSALSPHLLARVSLADKEPPAHSAGLPIKSCAEKANTSSLRGLHKTLLLVDIKTCCNISPCLTKEALSHARWGC